MSDGYDKAEAVTLLARAYGAMRESSRERESAIRELLAAVVSLDGVEGLSVKKPEPTIDGHVKTGDLYLAHGSNDYAGVYLGWRGEGFRVWRLKTVFNKPYQWAEVPLVYDGSTKRFEGKAEDTFTVPEPGLPRRRRSGLAVLIELALRAMAQKRED